MSKSESRNRQKIIAVRLSDNEYDIITSKAEKVGESRASFMRKAALGRKMRPSIDVNGVNELRRLGGLVKMLHNESAGMYSEDTATVLRKIARKVEELS